jgi:hypothetical protein
MGVHATNINRGNRPGTISSAQLIPRHRTRNMKARAIVPGGDRVGLGAVAPRAGSVRVGVIAAAAAGARAQTPARPAATAPRHIPEPCFRRAPAPPPRASAAASPGAGGAAPVAGKDWAALTERLVAASSLPFTFLVLPQALQNAANIAAGAPGALASISWVGYAAGLGGNALMCTHLASRGEATAVNVQLIGLASNLLILGQLWWAGVAPVGAFAGAAAAVLAVGGAGAARARGRLPDRQWLPFEAMVAFLGVVAVPQVGLSVPAFCFLAGRHTRCKAAKQGLSGHWFR